MQSLIGAGLRHAHFPYLSEKPQTVTNWFEIISENFITTRGYPFEVLMKLRQDYPIGMHGVSMNLASFEKHDQEYLKKLKELIELVDPMLVSDHLCWTGKHNNNLHNLLPFPYIKENLLHVVDKISQAQDYLGRQLLIENLSAYFQVEKQEFCEWEFLKEVAKKAGCKILLDINNIYVNSQNQQFNPYVYLDAIDVDLIGEIHLAGYSDMDNFLFDTHSKPVYPQVWELYKHKIKDCPNVPVLIEWDEDIPEFPVLDSEVKKALTIWSSHHGK